ncbi:MAG: GSCFA domain-containing protein [Bacteroidales bacterium]|nr:GSCFA domain-containing protein [Bacteroidales bacterium]
MKFRTEIDIRPAPVKAGYDTPVMLTGSCFAGEIGKQFSNGKMKALINPFGVIYNPLSTSRSLELIMEGKEFTAEDLFHYDNKYLSFFHDTGFSSRNRIEILDKINRSLSDAGSFLSGASFLFITFGTAWVYRWKENNRVVANCHKIPAARFTRELLKPEDIISEWLGIIEKLEDFNTGLNIVFTVSPVRHLKDGAHGNQLSKSILLVAINELLSLNGKLSYFPSYEIMLDELRDYRFYKKDMVHPSETAVDYIWEKFKDCYFTDNTKTVYERLVKITEAAKHVITGNDSHDNAKFGKTILGKIEMLLNEYPGIDLEEEEKYFKSLLNK